MNFDTSYKNAERRLFQNYLSHRQKEIETAFA